jgi:transposase
MEATPYWSLIREMRNPYNHRLRLVAYARQNGLKAAARLFQTTRRTVRKWLRRYQAQGPSGLVERSRAPHRQPRQTPPALEQQVVALRRQLPTFGARRLIREFDLPLSHRALERIWRAHGLIHKRRRKYQRKQDLAHIKAQWRLFQQLSADTKDLKDIPHYWPQAQRLGLPLIQYTAREVRSGLLFLAFARRRTAGASQLFAERIQRHLAAQGVDLPHLVWQTDNGTEFVGGHDRDGHLTGFPAALGESQHVRIPPAAHTYQSDVETVHRLVEDEFYDLERFANRADFLAKATVYQLYFNLARPNSHKGGLSPWEIIQQLQPQLSLRLCLLSPMFLDHFLDAKGGYLVCRHPYPWW